MATPYIKNDGVNYKIQGGLPSGGVDTLQFTDSASSFTQTLPAATGTLALTTIATGTNALVTTDMATAYRALDGLVMPNVKGYLTNTPPGSPSDGDCYIIGAAPTGAWAGQAGKVTRYSSAIAAWEFYAPKNGWMLQANSARETYRYTGSAWEIFYQEGTWAPTFTNLTIVGTPTYTGIFTKIGRSWSFTLRIQSTTSTSSTALGTFFALPSSPSSNSTLSAVNRTTNVGYGNGFIAAADNAYPPAWPAVSDVITSGTYFS